MSLTFSKNDLRILKDSQRTIQRSRLLKEEEQDDKKDIDTSNAPATPPQGDSQMPPPTPNVLTEPNPTKPSITVLDNWGKKILTNQPLSEQEATDILTQLNISLTNPQPNNAFDFKRFDMTNYIIAIGKAAKISGSKPIVDSWNQLKNNVASNIMIPTTIKNNLILNMNKFGPTEVFSGPDTNPIPNTPPEQPKQQESKYFGAEGEMLNEWKRLAGINNYNNLGE